MKTVRKIFRELLYWMTFPVPVGRRWQAALDGLFPILEPLHLCIAGEENLRVGEQKIAELRQWIKTLGPLERHAYRVWLDYYSGEIKRRRKALRERLSQKDFVQSRQFPTPKV